jgi:CRP-like cAMP-binding protein
VVEYVGGVVEAIVQLPLQALRISAEALRQAAPPGSRLHELLVRYLYASWQAAAQEAACHRHHSAERRCARWLLMTHDRAQTRKFAITHEMLAAMLGTRRATVTEALHSLQEAGLVRYARGQMTVLNRGELDRAACECYGIIRRALDSVVQPAGCPASCSRRVSGPA